MRLPLTISAAAEAVKGQAFAASFEQVSNSAIRQWGKAAASIAQGCFVICCESLEQLARPLGLPSRSACLKSISSDVSKPSAAPLL
jgi:hypothetical protein